MRVPRYVKLLLRPPTLDFETAAWEMFYILWNPRKAYKSIYYRQQNRSQWARDDPSFVVLVGLLVVLSAIAWGLAYAPTFGGIITLMLYMVVVDFVCLGLIAASIEWAVAQYYLLRDGNPGNSVEWAYSFDVHCNAFLVIWVYLYVLQFLLLPILQRQNWFSLFIGNTLYFAAFAHYFVVVFWGYSTLPLLQNTQVYLLPIGVLAVLYILSLFGFSIVRFLLARYFG